MAILTRTYTFTDGETAYGSQVDSEIANLVNTINSLDDGNTTWTKVKVTTLEPLADVDMSGNTLINLATPTTAGEAARYPITSAQISNDVVTGSTANSGGSAGNIDQGTISTPDFRTNAVTLASSTDDDTGSLSTNTLIGSFNITTIGKPVLIVGSASIYGESGTVLSKARCGHGITLAIDGTGLTSSVSSLSMDNTANSFELTTDVPIMFLHTPAAGAHTYALYYQTGGAANPSIRSYHLIAVELRA